MPLTSSSSISLPSWTSSGHHPTASTPDTFRHHGWQRAKSPTAQTHTNTHIHTSIDVQRGRRAESTMVGGETKRKVILCQEISLRLPSIDYHFLSKCDSGSWDKGYDHVRSIKKFALGPRLSILLFPWWMCVQPSTSQDKYHHERHRQEDSQHGRFLLLASCFIFIYVQVKNPTDTTAY